MFKKSADLIHLRDRAGSHATKGTGRGTVWWKAQDPEAFHPRELSLQKRLMGRQYYLAMVEFKAVVKMHLDALKQEDFATARAVRPTMRVLSRNLKKMKAEIQQIKTLLKDHPRQLRVRKLKNLLTK